MWMAADCELGEGGWLAVLCSGTGSSKLNWAVEASWPEGAERGRDRGSSGDSSSSVLSPWWSGSRSRDPQRSRAGPPASRCSRRRSPARGRRVRVTPWLSGSIGGRTMRRRKVFGKRRAPLLLVLRLGWEKKRELANLRPDSKELVVPGVRNRSCDFPPSTHLLVRETGLERGKGPTTTHMWVGWARPCAWPLASIWPQL